MAEWGALKIHPSIKAAKKWAKSRINFFRTLEINQRLATFWEATFKNKQTAVLIRTASFVPCIISLAPAAVALKTNILFHPQPAASTVSVHSLHLITITNTPRTACWFLTVGGHDAMCLSSAQTQGPGWWGLGPWTWELCLQVPLPPNGKYYLQRNSRT